MNILMQMCPYNPTISLFEQNFYVVMESVCMANLVVFVVKECVFQSSAVECLYGKFGCFCC